MVSYAELESEPWWGREVTPAPLDWLGDRLCAFYRQPRSASGVKGDNDHLKGAHRSQEWILNSEHCTNTGYTVQSGLTSWQTRLLAGHDFVPAGWGTTANRQLMIAHTHRLIDAAKRGMLRGVIEIGGTLDGKKPYGWHVVRGVPLSFDSSHVDHSHLTFDRTAVESSQVAANVFRVMIGAVKVYTLVKEIGEETGQVWLGDGMKRRKVKDQQELADIIYLAQTGQIAPIFGNGAVQVVANIDAYGKPLETAQVDVAALVAELKAALPSLVQIGRKVDEQLDQAFAGGADND